MSKRSKAKRRFRYFVQRERCQKAHCPDRAVACYLPNSYGRDRKPDEMLCARHAWLSGYCRSCGEFWGGINSFDFLNGGLCDFCFDEIQNDIDLESCDGEDGFWEGVVDDF